MQSLLCCKASMVRHARGAAALTPAINHLQLPCQLSLHARVRVLVDVELNMLSITHALIRRSLNVHAHTCMRVLHDWWMHVQGHTTT
jgi:hypothetical protein